MSAVSRSLARAGRQPCRTSTRSGAGVCIAFPGLCLIRASYTPSASVAGPRLPSLNGRGPRVGRCQRGGPMQSVPSLPGRIVHGRGGRRLSGTGGESDRGWPVLWCGSGGPGRSHGAGTCCRLGASGAPGADDCRHAAGNGEWIERIHRARGVVAGRRRHASPDDPSSRAARFRPTAGR